MSHGSPPDPGFLLRRYGIESERLEPLGEGLINRTFVARSPRGEFVVQCVNPMFAPALHEDIDAITAHIAGKGLPVPRLVRPLDGGLCITENGSIWRVMNRLPGESRSTLQRPAEAEAAGAMLARFHAALLDLEHDFHHVRTGVHDTARHLTRLRDALRNCTSHARFRQVEPLARRILEVGANLQALPPLTPRIVHGDPKINNFLFEPGRDRVLCLVDFDTLSRMALPLELGDAFRSWCNPGGEDTADARFSTDMMLAGARGYAKHAAPWITAAEIRSIVPATLIICIELSARFCADALNEDFFGWDPERFPSHSEHSEVRAAGQLALADSLRAKMPQLASDLPAIFAAAGAKV